MKKLILILLLFLYSANIYSQDNLTKYISTQIFVFGNNVTFPKQQSISVYKIAVYGKNSAVYNYLNRYFANKTIHGKKVSIINISKIKELDQKINILYVDYSKNIQIGSIYNAIHKKGVLLITYQVGNDNYIMINLLAEGKKFEIQTLNLYDEKIVASENLVAIGGTKLDLQGLYEKKVDLLKEKEDEINVKGKLLDSLSIVVNKQKLENEKSLTLLDQKSIDIENKQKQLEIQKKSLGQKSSEIQFQKHLILIAVIFVIIFIILSIIIYRALTENKRINQKLKQRNEEINQQKDQIELQAKEIEKQRDIAIDNANELAEKNKDIRDSIHYAQRIQLALLPHLYILDNTYKEHFLFYKPKDIVSGDFYWITEKQGLSIVVAADCTGHGVPGAFMSMLGISFLYQIVKNSEQLDTGYILLQLREMIIKSLKQDISDNQSSKDGMDMSIVIYDSRSKTLQSSGAYNSVYIVSNEMPPIIGGFEEYRILEIEEEENKLFEIKADRMPIGIYYVEKKPYTKNVIQLKEDDQIYLFSDGFPDLYNYHLKSKYNTKKFKQLLLKKSKLSMKEQKSEIEMEYKEWLGKGSQIDDIIILGLKI